MRGAFRETLHSYQGVIREAAKPGLSAERVAFLRTARAWENEKAARGSGVGSATQERIYAFQEEKNAIMQDLREDLRRIGRGQGVAEVPPGAVPVRWEEGGLVARWGRDTFPVTIGMLVADLEWGAAYALDPQTVPKHVQKRYAIEVTRQKLWPLMQRQIVAHESENPHLSRHLRGWLPETLKNETSEQLGFKAERLVFSLMKCLELDVDGAGFKAQKADGACTEQHPILV